MKSSLESKVRCKISSDSPVMAWLVEWAAGVITRYAVKPNGRTAIEEVKGKRSMRQSCGSRCLVRALVDVG